MFSEVSIGCKIHSFNALKGISTCVDLLEDGSRTLICIVSTSFAADGIESSIRAESSAR